MSNAREIKLREVGHTVKDYLEQKYDFNAAITGDPGCGKSTCCVQVCKEIDDNYNFDRNVLFYPKPEDILPAFNRLRPKQVLHIDETTRAIHKHQWYNPVIQQIEANYDTERWQTKATIFCIPRFWNLTENFRNDRVYMWIHVLTRGVASVCIKDKDKFQFDPWHIHFNKKLRMNRGQYLAKVADMDIDDYIKLEEKNPNFVGVLYFPDLTDSERQEYEARKEESRRLSKAAEMVQAEAETLSKNEQQWRAKSFKMAGLMIDKLGIPIEQISDWMGVDKNTIMRWNHDRKRGGNRVLPTLTPSFGVNIQNTTLERGTE